MQREAKGKAELTPMQKLARWALNVSPKNRLRVLAWLASRQAKRVVFLCGEEQDPYDLMSPGAPSYAFEPWLTIKFMSPVRVNGIRLQSCFECQPKSYTVSFMNGQDEVHKLTCMNDKLLLGDVSLSDHKFDPVTVTDVRIEVLANIDDGKRGRLSWVDFFSPDLPSGQTLFQYYMSRVGPGPSERQKYVEIHEKEGNDGRTLANPGSTFIFWTYSGGTWVQYSFTQGALLLTGYKMKTKDLRKWKLIATNNEAAKMEDWCVLHEGEIDKQDEHALRKYTVTSPAPFKFFRLVTKEKGFNDDTNVVLSYFDLDGVFFPN